MMRKLAILAAISDLFARKVREPKKHKNIQKGRDKILKFSGVRSLQNAENKNF